MWKILVVDDNFFNRKLIVEILKTKAQCDVAINGKEAQEAYEAALADKSPYDLILLDVAMPEVDGLQVLDIIRTNEAERGVSLDKGVPIIMVTVHKQKFISAFNKGCDDYILKPINVDKLTVKVEKFITLKPQK